MASNHHLATMYARLHAARLAQGHVNDDDSDAPADSPAPFSSSLHHGDYGLESSADTPDLFPPPAPTPPSGPNFNRSYQPPGMSNLGPIGSSMPSAAAKAEQSSNLLHLLKFSGAGQQSQQASSQAGSIGSHGSRHGSFHGSQASPTVPQQSQQGSFDGSLSRPTIHAPVPKPVDPQGLLATLMKGNQMHHEHSGHEQQQHHHHHQQQQQQQQQQQVTQPSNWNTGAPPADTQAYLLNLLNRPKPSQHDQSSTNDSSQPATMTPPSTNESAADNSRDYGHQRRSLDHHEPRLHESHHSSGSHGYGYVNEYAPSPPAKHEFQSPAAQHESARHVTQFDYSNPFDDFAAAPSPPQNRTPKSSTPGTSTTYTEQQSYNGNSAAYQILKNVSSATSSPGHAFDQKRSAQAGQESSQGTPHAEPEHSHHFARSNGAGERGDGHRETVSEAIHDLAEKADQEAQEALTRASEPDAHAHIADELEQMMSAQTDAEFRKTAEAAAKDIQHELDRPENRGVLEKNYSPEMALAIRGIVDDTAQGVADNWESAEADDIVVIEEEPEPVKVYNFPMKPWISITMQDNNEPRPQFRDDVVLDIARLKKDFDQIDRNLVCATESYMVYGMSKAGGLRVIRQEDGKDAKLFTDTKDRIFNVSVSTTPSDIDATPKESIIGTGISGTVYYVLIKNGDKDHLDDPHPEQYGFALPPVTNSQEGDAPGGVLKTRARISSSHPEFFAVGRGKTINVIWPAYIMQNNLFKAGHDRVVDTELLTKQCALKINTGKAGKDFTFSQDDTTIVSLDKSGRVKFWDVRDLTTPQEDGDSRFPIPAHTDIEVKEPLLTLNTTPEGEKAWPTSVLLLDKQRPYQKRCALRYMIVGMKQNHTLQLWDLALGKPVQEFNLPHSKESDAVCSVMYHPPTGMIVVGHPTRNSIYFLHLSAPKYTIKGLSQVDYIQKLVAKDASIPEPDSTAVISGVREYSFDNKGILRSLDILVNPAVSSDGEEQTLFELYAMHSKGMTGIWVKQPELGWTKDNKVIAGVDATEVGLVKIAKLKELPSIVVAAEPAPVDDVQPLSIAQKPTSRENGPPSISGLLDVAAKKASTDAPAAPATVERKDAEVPALQSAPAEKGEKKTRKKRDRAAAAAAAAAAADKPSADATQTNGATATSAPKGDGKLTNALSPESIHGVVQQVVASLSTSVSQLVATEMRDHRASLEQDFTTRESNFMKKQKELLELVSSVLNENVQTVLTKLINDQFDENVVPQLGPLISKTISEQLDGKIGGKVSHSVQNQMQKLLPAAVAQALQKPELSKAISDKVVSRVSLDMEESFQQTLMNTITPIFGDMAVAASRTMIQDVRVQTAAQIEELEQRHIADNKKIDQLTALVSQLQNTVSTMASTQAQFQERFLKLHEQMSQRQAAPAPAPAPVAPSQYSQSYDSPVSNTNSRALVPYPNKPQNNVDHELQELIGNIASHMEAADYETALVRWLQGERKQEVFDQYIVKYKPNFLQELPALVLLSVGSVISENLEHSHTRDKVNWLELILHNLLSSMSHIDTQVRDVVPSIMSQFVSRLEHLYLQISSRAPNDNILKHISTMVNMANRVRDTARHHNY